MKEFPKLFQKMTGELENTKWVMRNKQALEWKNKGYKIRICPSYMAEEHKELREDDEKEDISDEEEDKEKNKEYLEKENVRFHPRDYRTFKKIIKNEGLNIIFVTKETPCSYHNEYKYHLRDYEKRDYKKIKGLKTQINKCRIHFEQYQTIYNWLQQQVIPICYQDYITYSGLDYAKTHDLVFVIVDKRGDEKKIKYIHNFIDVLHNANTTRFVWDYILRHTDEFDDFKRINKIWGRWPRFSIIRFSSVREWCL